MGGSEEVLTRWSTCSCPSMHTDTQTLTPQIRQLVHQTLSSARGITVWVVGEYRRSGSSRGREGELMENGVVSQLIGDALPDSQCLLFLSWLPDAAMNCTDTIRAVTPTVMPCNTECSTAAASTGAWSVICQWYFIPALWLHLKCVGGPGDVSFPCWMR